MGIIDNPILQNINTEIKKICKENNLPFIFKTDDGDFETGIEFCANRAYHPPISKDWEECKLMGNEIKCPDLLDYCHKLIIEYEEEPTPRKKGHTEESKRDTNRDKLYTLANFKLFKIWESEYQTNEYKSELIKFLKL